jgi:hypothetical protein
MANPKDLVVPLLREMRQDITMRLDKVDARLDKMDESLVTFRHALSADSLLSKVVIGEYEERLSAIEKRLSDLETQK